MRRVLFSACAAGLLPMALTVGTSACTRDRAADLADAASSSDPPAAASTVPAGALVVPSSAPPGPPSRVLPDSPASTRPAPGTAAVGNGCSPGRDSIACTADGLGALTCAGGQWRMLEACRGPGHCLGVGSALTCDTGLPQPGDACVPARSEPRCRSAKEAITCMGGKWMVSPCAGGSLCTPGGPRGHAGCK